MVRAKKLYRRPSAIGGNRAEGGKASAAIDVSQIPTIGWPDGRHCFEANLFLFHLFYAEGLSTLGGGGTLTTYAAYLSHLLRYCHQEQLDLSSVQDARFILFMRRLKSEVKMVGREVKLCRDNNGIVRMGRFYLRFFEFIGELHGIDSMVGKRILAERKKESRMVGKRTVYYEYWEHRVFPAQDEVAHRRPLGDSSLEKVFSANNAISKGFIHKRRYIMLLLLKATGCRRIEVAMLTVSAITQALLSRVAVPILELPNVKQSGKPGIRKVPISRGDLLEIEKYLIARSKVIRTTCGTRNDSDVLLINSHTGEGLVPNTITTEFSSLVKSAQLEGQACAHMLRHRYLVNLFIELVLESKTRDKDVFQMLLFSTDALHMKLRERSGHMSNSGIEWYTKLALERLQNVEGAMRHVQAREVVKGAKARFDMVERHAADEGLSAEEELRLLKQTLGLVVADIDALTKFDPD